MYDSMGEHHSAKLMAMEIMGMPFRKETKTVSIVRDAAHHILEVRISPQWYRCSGRMVPRGADAWYHL